MGAGDVIAGQQQRRLNRNPINLRTLGIGFVAVGLVVMVLGGLQAYQQYSVLRWWMPVPAEFVRTEVRNEKFQTNIQMGRADRYMVTWTFRYRLGGVEHEATADPDVHGTRAQMVAWIHRFHPGQQVTIRYNPANPAQISAAAYDWITFSHAAWVGAWGLGIAILGFALRRFAQDRA
jgi:Protein of unknown function (DUF3592)